LGSFVLTKFPLIPLMISWLVLQASPISQLVGILNLNNNIVTIFACHFMEIINYN
jgi:hypothetical protein